MLFSPWNVSSLNECPRLCECWKKSHYCGNVWIAPSLFETPFWSIHKPFFWDFPWHVSVEAFPLWARRCNAWYSCQWFWCTPCNRWSWDSITLSASWGNIFAEPQILTWYAAVLNCEGLCMEWESLCVHVVFKQCTGWFDLQLVQELWFFLVWTFFCTKKACPCARLCLFLTSGFMQQPISLTKKKKTGHSQQP